MRARLSLKTSLSTRGTGPASVFGLTSNPYSMQALAEPLAPWRSDLFLPFIFRPFISCLSLLVANTTVLLDARTAHGFAYF